MPSFTGGGCERFGPRLQAALVVLSVRNRVSRRDLVELGEELFGARLSTGSVDAILTRASRGARRTLRGSARAGSWRGRALNADETGWRTAGERRALWGLFTSAPRVLPGRARPSRGSRQEPARRHPGGRQLRPLVGIPQPAVASPPALLVTSEARLRRPRGRTRSRERVRRARPPALPRGVLLPGRSSKTPKTGAS